MQNEKQHINSNSAFATLLDSIATTNENDIQIGEHKRIIEELENKKKKDIRKTSIIAAKYFTKEKITELHQKSVDLLSCNDFSEEEYFQIFSDISNIDFGHIVFLADRQKEIESFEEKLNDNNHQFENNESSSIMSRLADILMKGGADHD